MMRLFSLLGLAVAVAPWGASAETSSAKVEDRKGMTYNEIERGFYFEANGGYWALLNPPTKPGTTAPYSSGHAVGLEMGIDIGERVSPSIFLLSSVSRTSSKYTGLGADGTLSGDFRATAPGAAVKVRLLGFDDSQGVGRTWLFVRGGAGVVFYSPKQLLPTLDVMITAGPGIEYYTRLRHFVIGLEANLNFMAVTRSFGFSILPTVKYAF